MKTHHLHSKLRLMKDLRNMATLNRQCAPDDSTVRAARSWEARFTKQIRKLTIRLRGVSN